MAKNELSERFQGGDNKLNEMNYKASAMGINREINKWKQKWSGEEHGPASPNMAKNELSYGLQEGDGRVEDVGSRACTCEYAK